MKMIHFGDHGPCPLATPMVLWQLHVFFVKVDKQTQHFDYSLKNKQYIKNISEIQIIGSYTMQFQLINMFL